MASFGSRSKAVPTEDVLHRLIGDPVTKVGQGTDDAVISPARVLSCHAENPRFDFDETGGRPGYCRCLDPSNFCATTASLLAEDSRGKYYRGQSAVAFQDQELLSVPRSLRAPRNLPMRAPKSTMATIAASRAPSVCLNVENGQAMRQPALIARPAAAPYNAPATMGRIASEFRLVRLPIPEKSA